jgi:FkbM family methyltransferase
MNLRAYIHRIETILSHPGNRGRRPAAIWSALQWFAQVHVWRQPDTTKSYHGVRLRRYPDSQGARSLAYYGTYPIYDPMKFCDRFLRQGDAFLDIGANIGLFTCLAAAIVGESGRVDCFEASSKNFKRLKENIALNGWSHVYAQHLALGPEEGQISFTADADEIGHVLSIAVTSAGQTEEVSVDALDNVFAADDPAYILGKIDIEGYELPCLRGAVRHLEKMNPPIWFFEANGASRRYGISEHELFAFFRSRGFRLGTYDATAHRLDFGANLWDDVIAVSARGEALIAERLPDLEIV